ncbi:O-antigen ligase family protein [Aurantiacibacter sediminis]|uniref:O-antigen ligase family protein n=1 Tax=Aurantiacibacter sediminis TaxID=2793064 RepID=A0ABS0N1Q1_9SPHN|nr:O-antigen ligase family protein [Aurantiacibacter sediminis]MBH5321235.1 O-antigen ligase family protein [Aurantiacibacter sediminis]
MADPNRLTGVNHQSRQFALWRNAPVLHLCVLITLAILLGGGGVAYGLSNMVIQLAAIAVLAVNWRTCSDFARYAPRALVVLVAATLALPLIQLIYLPPTLWQSLPGRDLIAESFAIAGLGADRWFPASVDPMRTLVAFCGTLAPLVIIAIGSTLERDQKLALLRFTLLCVSGAFLLGVVQFASGNQWGLLYNERSDPGVFYATFANRNSTALLFVIALTFLAALPRPKDLLSVLVTGTATVFFTLAVVLTQSRTGMALLAMPLGLFLLRLGAAVIGREAQEQANPRMAFGIALAAAVFVSGLFAASYMTGGRVSESVDRFVSAGAADRPEMWEDSYYAAGQYWPVGSGMGTFDEVFQVHESLEHISPRRAGRAHSDWLEIAIEGGIFALVIALLWLGWVLLSALPRRSGKGTWLRLGAGAAVGAIALQSLVDYPLRNQSLLCIAALCIVLMVSRREPTS